MRARERRTVDVRLGKLDEPRRQHLGHAADARRDDEQARTRRLEDADPERLGERRVEEDLGAAEELQGGRERESALGLGRRGDKEEEDARRERARA